MQELTVYLPVWYFVMIAPYVGVAILGVIIVGLFMFVRLVRKLWKELEVVEPPDDGTREASNWFLGIVVVIVVVLVVLSLMGFRYV
jgi:hypothetical protein